MANYKLKKLLYSLDDVHTALNLMIPEPEKLVFLKIMLTIEETTTKQDIHQQLNMNKVRFYKAYNNLQRLGLIRERGDEIEVRLNGLIKNSARLEFETYHRNHFQYLPMDREEKLMLFHYLKQPELIEETSKDETDWYFDSTISKHRETFKRLISNGYIIETCEGYYINYAHLTELINRRKKQ